jgi:hypothetical protein
MTLAILSEEKTRGERINSHGVLGIEFDMCGTIRREKLVYQSLMRDLHSL